MPTPFKRNASVSNPSGAVPSCRQVKGLHGGLVIAPPPNPTRHRRAARSREHISDGWMHRPDGWMHRPNGWMHRPDGWMHRPDGWMHRPVTADCRSSCGRKAKVCAKDGSVKDFWQSDIQHRRPMAYFCERLYLFNSMSFKA